MNISIPYVRVSAFQLLILLLVFCVVTAHAQQSEIQYLSGTDKDHTVLWDFYCTGGSNSNHWTKIAVPSNWETQGFGSINYGQDKIKSKEKGLYKYQFKVCDVRRKRVFIVFEGSMTDTKVSINGIEAGPVHQGGFYEFKYDISQLIKPDATNLLEVAVSKVSDNVSVNKAERGNSDFWIFGGIYRPVYLEIVPEHFIDHVAIDAQENGDFRMKVYPGKMTGKETVYAQLQSLSGTNIGKPFSAKWDVDSAAVLLKTRLSNPRLWSAEFPNRYQVLVTLRNRSGIIHQITKKFGFRTVEVRLGKGLYVNNTKVYLKGCDRHSFWPETGRTLSHGVHLLDVDLMKAMNMNAVRMSHYPPDKDFLDVCDSLGLYVLDELTGWQAKYDTIVGKKLVREMVQRDANHPSILFWDNGNEGGFNFGLDNEFSLYDLQQRKVLHPWAKFSGMDTKHYPDYSYLLKPAAGGEVLMPTEFMHGLYDGGAGASLGDFWRAMLTHPYCAGGFIWALFDEALFRKDKGGVFDTDGNHAPDGILGPHREKEGSFYAIREIWSPVYIVTPTLNEHFDGRLQIENRYAFTDLGKCRFSWKLIRFARPADISTIRDSLTGQIASINLAPGKAGSMPLGLPADWNSYDALYLAAYGPDQRLINTWSWILKSPDTRWLIASQVVRTPPRVEESSSTLIVSSDGKQYFFDKKTGYLEKVRQGKKTTSLSGGPVLAGLKTQLSNFCFNSDQSKCVVESNYTGEGTLNCRWTFIPGKPAELEYEYVQKGAFDFMGITFNYPEEKISGMRWLGDGPYRVWKNRLEGANFGVWHKTYNDAVTGENWVYPEFKGYHANVYWVSIESTESKFTVYVKDPGVFLQMLPPKREKAALANNNVEPAFPQGSIGFMNAISPIGTKFQSPDKMGPQGQKTIADGKPVSGILWFDFFSK